MYHDDLTCGEIVDDLCYIPKSFCSMKEDFGGGRGCGLFLASCSGSEFQNMG